MAKGYWNYINNKRKYFDYTMNRMHDKLLEDEYSVSKRKFIAKIVSGEQTSSTIGSILQSLTPQNRFFHFNIRFIEEDEKFNFFPDPDFVADPNERAQTISLHPKASWEKGGFFRTAPKTGAIVRIEDIGGKLIIAEILSEDPSTSGRGGSGGRTPAATLIRDLNAAMGNPAKLVAAETTYPGVTGNDQDNMAKRIYEAFGLPPVTMRQNQVLFFGIRKFNPTNLPKYKDTSEVDKFVDTMLAVVKITDREYKNYEWTITTTPAINLLRSYLGNINGTAVLASPQYIEKGYELGNHRNTLGLVQNKKFQIMRNKDQDGFPDVIPKANTVKLYTESGTGINIHKAQNNKSKGKTPSKRLSGNYSSTSDKSSLVYKFDSATGRFVEARVKQYSWSAGCQTFPDLEDHYNFMMLCKKEMQSIGTNKWDYILVESDDYGLIKNGNIPAAKTSIADKMTARGIKLRI